MKKQLLRFAAVRTVAAPATEKLLYLLLRDNVGKNADLTICRKELARTLWVCRPHRH